MTSYGAKVIRGGDQEALLRQLLERSNHYPCTIFCPRAGYSNPFGVEGFKTIAFKIYEQLGRSAPDRVFVPTGSGDGIYGVWKPLRELRDLGWIAKAPKMIACQASGADSAFRAFQRKVRRAEMFPSTSTVASPVRNGSQETTPCEPCMSRVDRSSHVRMTRPSGRSSSS